MSATESRAELYPGASPELIDVRIQAFGQLTAISRTGGQGRVHRPAQVPPWLGPHPLVVKLYRRAPPPEATEVLSEMVQWERTLLPEARLRLSEVAAWPLAIVTDGGQAAGIVMRDVTPRYAVPFEMPSGKRDTVLLALEHLLGGDGYLQSRGLPVHLSTLVRAHIAERISGALGFLHQQAIVASDIAPSNLLIRFGQGAASVCFIDCDSMVFRGRQALPAVETGDWDLPARFGERPEARASDAYKLGLVILRLFARSHDARTLAPNLRSIPEPVRDLLHRSLDGEPPNRPPAGEWQRALQALVAQPDLDARYPGPVPAPRPQPGPALVPAAARPDRPRPVVKLTQGAATGPYAARTRSPGAGSRRNAAAAVPARRPSWLHGIVLVLWAVAAAAVIALIASRVLTPSTPAPRATTTYYAPGPGGTVYPTSVEQQYP